MRQPPPDRFHIVQASGAGDATVDYFCFEYTVWDRDIYLRVCELEPHEVDLNAGRFARFSRYRQSCRVAIERRPPQESHAGVIDWISQHTQGPWSLWMEVKHVSDYWIEWSFERPSDAIMFKLVWG